MSSTREELVNSPNDVSLIDLYDDVLRTIAEFAPADKPHETMRLMSLSNKSFYTLFKPDLTKRAVKKALVLAADASDNAVPTLLQMLDKNPVLLFKAGKVVTRSGLLVENVTVYEFLLGAGDPELAEQVAAYFAKVEGGEAERIKQYEKYKSSIDSMLEQKTYDLTGLISIIKNASPEDVQAALNKQTTGSALDKALESFRQAVTVNKISTPQLHYNYPTLMHAFELYDREWNNLYQASGKNYAKLDLVWRQVIGYLQRGLPAVDRFAFAMGLYDLVENKKPLVHKTDYKYGEGSFPDAAPNDSSRSGLGFDYGIYGARCVLRAGAARRGALARCSMDYKTYVEQKRQTCRTYATTANTEISRVCDRLK